MTFAPPFFWGSSAALLPVGSRGSLPELTASRVYTATRDIGSFDPCTTLAAREAILP